MPPSAASSTSSTSLAEGEAASYAQKARQGASATVFDLLERDGLIGCIKGKPGSPTDLATNPKHMEGFGGG